MPLEEYRRKRDFAKTPEPAPGDARPATPPATPPAKGGRFVVQRHRATRLHYDFRLEIDGVLVSWAVPKGPTLDPSIRRMAVHVEDHPIEYFDFEGVIPKGEYGGGDVIVWDWGTWAPEAETPDPGPAIAAGELKFALRGEKLRGRFTIVRTSGRRGKGAARAAGAAFDDEDGEQWLLIHKKDGFAQAGWDAEDHPQSVKTGRTNDEVKAQKDAIWISRAPAATAEIDLSAAVQSPMPTFVPPMAATLSDKPFRDEDWLFEVKWDGYRLEAVVRDGKVTTFTRNGNDGATYFPKLLEPATWIEAREAIVDGEVVALGPDGLPDFGLLQELTGTQDRRLVYQVFDLLHLDGRSLLAVPLEDRKALLRTVLREADRRVRYADHVIGEGPAFLAAASAQGLEGVIAKYRRSRYEPGVRSKAWLKLKHRPEQELVVGGWTPGEGAATELGAVIVGVHEDASDAETGEKSDRRLRFAGKVGSGFTAPMRKRLRERLAPLATPDPPFDPAPPKDTKGRWGGDLKGAVWVRPELVIRAELGGWTRDGLVRQAAFKGIDEGKDPTVVVRERPVSAASAVDAVESAHPDPHPRDRISAVLAPRPSAGGPTPPGSSGGAQLPQAASSAELAALEALGKEGTWTVGGFELKLTNLDKVLFEGRPARPGDAGGPASAGPDADPVTKRDLIRYFTLIAPAMLPHLAERPLNLHRYPDGAAKPGFWQKDIPATAPAWLRRWHETGVEARDANDHLVADRVAALAWLANQAAFEVHAWTSRLHDPARPDFALIDIDPGERTTWDETLTLARLYRTALEHLGVRGYPKTTGRRGLQVWIPITRGRYTFADTSAWVEAISRTIGKIVPDLVSWEWSKSERKGRARLDYTQNAQIKTLVAPYAVRPAPAAPVSTPIDWSELDDPDLRPDRWTIRTVVARVAERGDLFAPAQTDEQDLPKL